MHLKALIATLLLISVLSSCDRGKSTMNKSTIENKHDNSEMLNVPEIIKVYNDVVINSYTLYYQENWGKWIVTDDVAVDDYNSYAEYVKDKQFDVVLGDDLDKVLVKTFGAGEDSFQLFELFEDDKKIIYLFINKSSTPEWVDVESKLVYLNKVTNKIELKERISAEPLNIQLFYNQKTNVDILDTYQAMSVNSMYDSNLEKLVITPFISYLFNCDVENMITNVTEEERKEICSLFSEIETSQITLKWNEDKELFDRF